MRCLWNAAGLVVVAPQQARFEVSSSVSKSTQAFYLNCMMMCCLIINEHRLNLQSVRVSCMTFFVKAMIYPNHSRAFNHQGASCMHFFLNLRIFSSFAFPSLLFQTRVFAKAFFFSFFIGWRERAVYSIFSFHSTVFGTVVSVSESFFQKVEEAMTAGSCNVINTN